MKYLLLIHILIITNITHSETTNLTQKTSESIKSTEANKSENTAVYSHLTSLNQDKLTVEDLEELEKDVHDDSILSDSSLNSPESEKVFKNESEKDLEWMMGIDNDLDELDDSETKRSDQKAVQELENKEDIEDNHKANLEILEITSQNRNSYTELQILVNFMESEMKIEKDGKEDRLMIKDFKFRKDNLTKDILDEIEVLKTFLKTRPRDEVKKLHNEIVENLQTVSEFSDSVSYLSGGSNDSDDNSNLIQNSSNSSNISNPDKLKTMQDVKDLEKIIRDTNQREAQGVSLKNMNMEDMLKMVSDMKPSKNPLENLMKQNNKDPQKNTFLNLIKGVIGDGGFNPDLMKKNLKESFNKLIDTPELSNMVKKLGNSEKFKQLKSNLNQKMPLPDISQLISNSMGNKSQDLPKIITGGNNEMEKIQKLNVKKEQLFEKDRKDVDKNVMQVNHPVVDLDPKRFEFNRKTHFGNFLHAFGHGKIKTKRRELLV
jgi:hypothetical protein